MTRVTKFWFHAWYLLFFISTLFNGSHIIENVCAVQITAEYDVCCQSPLALAAATNISHLLWQLNVRIVMGHYSDTVSEQCMVRLLSVSYISDIC